MTPSSLKQLTMETEPYFFTQAAMKFFGDRMDNYGVRKTTIKNIPVWELYRKHPVKHGLQTSAYFDQKTFKQVF